MILFFRSPSSLVYAVGHAHSFSKNDLSKLTWLFGGANPLEENALTGHFIGPRKEMVTPWSTNAVEITQTMGIQGITRIEEFQAVNTSAAAHDPMLQVLYRQLDQDLFIIHHAPEPIVEIQDLVAYNQQEGLALSEEEITYLKNVTIENRCRPKTQS